MSGSDSEADTNRSDVASMLQIRVLGPLEIVWGGRVVDLGGVKARALIARLLIDRGLIVSVDRLVDSLWGDHDGEGAEIAAQRYGREHPDWDRPIPLVRRPRR